MQSQLLGFLSQLNQAHRARFPHLTKGKQIKVLISDGTKVEGIIESISSDGISINNQAPSAGGYNQTVVVTWVDIIKEL